MLLRRGLMSFTVRCFETPLTVDQVDISLSSRFNCLAHPDLSVEHHKKQRWEQLKHHSPNLFNASKFRLHDLSTISSDHHSSLKLRWGLTDYATYVGTCCSSLAPQLLEDGERLHRNPFAFFSRKVGVAAALETADGYVALIKRSKNVGLYQNLCDTPGGHPEPHSIQLTEDVLQTLEDNCQKVKEMEDAARQEFFQSITNEVHEEVNVDPALQQPPELLGVVFQTDACTPSFAFRIRTKCTAQELKEFYSAGPADKFESMELLLLSVEKLLADGSTTLYELKEKLQLTPSGKGTLELWKQHTLRAG